MSLKLEKISSNKSFGLLFFIVFLLIAIWPLKSGNSINFWFLIPSIIFLVLGILNSKLLHPLNKLWHYLGLILGLIVSPIVMGIIYFFVITPIGLMLKFFGKDLLQLKMQRKTTSYWMHKQKINSSMKNQF